MERAAIQVSGGSNLEKSTAEVMRVLEKVAEALRCFHSYEAVRAYLLEVQEPSPAILALVEGALRFMPRLAESWLKTGAQSFLADTRGPKGRPNAINPDQYWSICTEVSACELKGASHGEAKRTIAKRHQVHTRTIERIWADRKTYSQDAVSLEDVESFVALLFETNGKTK